LQETQKKNWGQLIFISEKKGRERGGYAAGSLRKEGEEIRKSFLRMPPREGLKPCPVDEEKKRERDSGRLPGKKEK